MEVLSSYLFFFLDTCSELPDKSCWLIYDKKLKRTTLIEKKISADKSIE